MALICQHKRISLLILMGVLTWASRREHRQPLPASSPQRLPHNRRHCSRPNRRGSAQRRTSLCTRTIKGEIEEVPREAMGQLGSGNDKRRRLRARDKIGCRGQCGRCLANATDHLRSRWRPQEFFVAATSHFSPR